MSRDETMYLEDITQSCEKIMQFTRGLDQAGLVRDQRTYDAVIRNLEIMGEAAKHISEQFRDQLPHIEWRRIAGLRDMLAHVYFGVDDDIVWDVVRNKVPELLRIVSEFLNQQQD